MPLPKSKAVLFADDPRGRIHPYKANTYSQGEQMTRHWEPGGWVVEPVARTCRTCGATIPERIGIGRPRLSCHAHGPARGATQPLVAGICEDCAEPYRTRLGSPVCSPCRAIRHNAQLSHDRLLVRL